MKKWLYGCVAVALCWNVLGVCAKAETQEMNEPSIAVGGVEITEENAADVFGDGRVTYDEVSHTLTLLNYTYEGPGYEYDKDEEAGVTYTAVIVCDGPLNVEVLGENTLINTDREKGDAWVGDGILADGNLTVTGAGILNIKAAYGIASNGDVVIDGCSLYIESKDTSILSGEGNVTVQNHAKAYLDSLQDEIYAKKEVTIIDSLVEDAAEDVPTAPKLEEEGGNGFWIGVAAVVVVLGVGLVVWKKRK